MWGLIGPTQAQYPATAMKGRWFTTTTVNFYPLDPIENQLHSPIPLKSLFLTKSLSQKPLW